MPVASRSVVLAAPTHVSQIRGSGIGLSSGPGMRPLGEYGYCDW